MADSKEEEAFNMLTKTSKVFTLKEYRQLEKLDSLSLSDFHCGLIIPSTLFIRLPTHLRVYKCLKLSFSIDWQRQSTAQVEAEKLRKKLRKLGAFNNGLNHLGFLNMARNSALSTSIFRILLDLNRESLESIHLKYTANTLREESRILL